MVKKIKELPKGNKLVERIVWSNGVVVRKFCGQDKRYPKNGYRKMVMVLYEVGEDNEELKGEVKYV